MSERKVINFIGHPSSGKSTAAKYVGEAHGFEVIRASQLIEKYARHRGKVLENRGDYLACWDFMLQENPDAFIEPALQNANSRIVYDGLRIPAAIDKLRSLSKMAVIALVCPEATRFERAMENRDARGQKDKTTFEEFLADEAEDYYNPDRSYGSVLTVMEEADYIIDTYRLSEKETFLQVDSALVDAGLIG